MKRLTLLRHAKSSWSDGSLADIDRPLAKRGLRDAPRMADRLAQRGVKPDLILTSSARRARQTAELVEPALRRGRSLEIRVDPEIYLAGTGKLLDIVSALEDELDDVVLIGHNPGLTQLANTLLPTLRLANLPTAGSVGIDCAATNWRDVDSAVRSLRFYDYPKNPDPV